MSVADREEWPRAPSCCKAAENAASVDVVAGDIRNLTRERNSLNEDEEEEEEEEEDIIDQIQRG